MAMFTISLSGAILNLYINQLSIYSGTPLYVDTILTISITLVCGLFWGSLCGALTNAISNTIWFWGWEGYLFSICNIATAVTTWFFMHLFPRELEMNNAKQKISPVIYKSGKLSIIIDRMITLILLAFALCLVMSIFGGLIAAFILSYSKGRFEETNISAILAATMFGQNFPVVLTEIFSRIPVNIIDRLISVFAGYGIALGLKSFFKIFSVRPKPSSS